MTIPGLREFAALSRRLRTLIVSVTIFLVLVVVGYTMRVPYVILSPGPTYNTLGVDDKGDVIITIDGKAPNKTTGHLNMTTVNVTTQSITLYEALTGWLAGDQVVVPRSTVYPPGQSQNQVNQQNTQEFAESQDNAVAAASCQLGYPKQFGVVSVESDTGAYQKLQPADVLKTVDGVSVNSGAALQALEEKDAAGTTVTVGFVRQGKAETASIKLSAASGGRAGGILGISVGDVCQLPFSVDLGLGNQIGGPSAGLMFALGIMDKVGKVDLTRGRFIAGTGTIDTSGNVGEIGGIQLKMIAARRAGATVFLAPAGNCADVRGDSPRGLEIVKVSTLAGAVQDLLALQNGGAVPHC